MGMLLKDFGPTCTARALPSFMYIVHVYMGGRASREANGAQRERETTRL